MSTGESPQRIAKAVNTWLAAEIRSSGEDSNTYLDDYNKAIEGLAGGWDHPYNFTARKHESHIDVRLPQSWETFLMTLEPQSTRPERDYQTGYLLFTPKMQISGTYRTACYMQARNASDYLAIRHSSPSGIDIGSLAAERLHKWLPEADNFTEARINILDLKKRLDLSAQIGRKAIEDLCERTTRELDFGEEESMSTFYMEGAQRAWSTFVVDGIILAAKLRKGELESVPFLDAKSIRYNPQVYYPFKGESPPVLGSLAG